MQRKLRAYEAHVAKLHKKLDESDIQMLPCNSRKGRKAGVAQTEPILLLPLRYQGGKEYDKEPIIKNNKRKGIMTLEIRG